MVDLHLLEVYVTEVNELMYLPIQPWIFRPFARTQKDIIIFPVMYNLADAVDFKFTVG